MSLRFSTCYSLFDFFCMHRKYSGFGFRYRIKCYADGVKCVSVGELSLEFNILTEVVLSILYGDELLRNFGFTSCWTPNTWLHKFWKLLFSSHSNNGSLTKMNLFVFVLNGGIPTKTHFIHDTYIRWTGENTENFEFLMETKFIIRFNCGIFK